MQKKRSPSDTQLNKWVQDIGRASGSSVQRHNPNHWQVTRHNSVGQYTVDIRDHGSIVSYGTSLMPDVVGRNRANFYGDALDLNGKLYGGPLCQDTKTE